MRIFDLCLSTPWAITADALEVILAIAARDDVPLRAVEAAKGRPLDNTRAVTYRDNVAIIPIDGSIVRHGDMFSEVSGAVSVDTLAKDFTVALNDRSINAILFSIDSPGGEINGIHEFANMIYAARGVKPIEAYVSHLGCSAAYWIASACDRIVCDATAAIGSIGVIAAIPNPTKGRVEIVSSQSPRKRPDITTESGRAQIQTRIDDYGDVFIGNVARNRAVTADTVQTKFGEGDVRIGQKALAAGMVDQVSSFEATLAALAARAKADGEAAAGNREDIVGQDEQAQQHAGRSKGFWAWVRGDGSADLPPDGPPQGEFTGDARLERARQIDDPRVTQLETRNKALEERLFATEASAFVERLVLGHQALPTEVAGLKDLYIQAARDDAAAGETTRVARLTSTLGAREAHVKAGTGEKLFVVPNQITTETKDAAAELDADEADAREWGKRRNARAAK